MAVTSSLSALLNTLTQSLTAASDSAEKTPTLAPPKDGISLLNTKNELFLSYLQNLVFLILLKLRNRRSSSNTKDEEPLDNLVVKKLVELTVFLERGALNLEGKLKYQIDKVLRAAQDAENATKINGTMKSNGASRKKSAEDNGGSEESEDDSDQESTSDAGGVAMKASEINDLQYRPNPSALTRPSFAGAEEDNKTSEDGLYKPPRIQPTAMPTTERREKEARKPNKSATLDEYINTEMSAAPYAELALEVVSLMAAEGIRAEKQREEERARKEYEETNYVRLPKESKKERAKRVEGKMQRYGGEEWRGLGEGLDRIEEVDEEENWGKVVVYLRKVEKERQRMDLEVPAGLRWALQRDKKSKTLVGETEEEGSQVY